LFVWKEEDAVKVEEKEEEEEEEGKFRVNNAAKQEILRILLDCVCFLFLIKT
jgi:hypothetical protein